MGKEEVALACIRIIFLFPLPQQNVRYSFKRPSGEAEAYSKVREQITSRSPLQLPPLQGTAYTLLAWLHQWDDFIRIGLFVTGIVFAPDFESIA